MEKQLTLTLCSSTVLIVCLVVHFFIIGRVSSLSKSEYLASRVKVVSEEEHVRTGAGLQLTEAERKVNETLMKYKHGEISDSRMNDAPFLPAVNFMKVKGMIDKSKVFQILRRMPKGSVLHIHDAAIADMRWLVSKATYLPECYMCFDEHNILKFYFFQKTPPKNKDCPWQKVNDVRRQYESAVFDQWLYNNLTLVVDDPAAAYPTVHAAWRKFSGVFKTVDGLFSYAPVFKAYYHKALMTFYQDNVQYMEVRALLREMYELDGTVHEPEWMLKTYKTITEQFMKDHPDFTGAKIIFSSIRSKNHTVIESDIKACMDLMVKYPGFVVGYDMASEEGAGHPLRYFLDQLLLPSQLHPRVKLPYFFHAGETDWNQEDVDMNVVDAVLLNATRIGHGYALTKHPEALRLSRDRDIPLEVNPISNQVLKLVDDLRNHPAVSLIATGHPLVISSDDPAMWGAEGVSYDWYEAFMAIAGSQDDLRLLKQLAIDSIRYSAMSDAERKRTLSIFTKKWNEFIKEMGELIDLNVL